MEEILVRQKRKLLYLSSTFLERLTASLIILYVISIPIQTSLIDFSGLNITLPELIFLFLAPLSIFYFIKTKQKLWFSRIDIFVIGWLCANIIIGLHTGFNFNTTVEVIKVAYLTLLYFILRLSITPKLLKQFPNLMAYSAAIAALTGILGLGLIVFKVESY